jgi:hypothetical protein
MKWFLADNSPDVKGLGQALAGVRLRRDCLLFLCRIRRDEAVETGGHTERG